jgi:6-phosphogluconate dehydrogenase
MQLGMIGLGRMGANMTERLIRAGHTLVCYDRSADAIKNVAAHGAKPADSLAAMVAQLSAPRAVWLMVPAGQPVDDTLTDLLKVLSPGDIVIDGGNSRYSDTLRRAIWLREHKLQLVDCGTSGGIWGLKEGYSLMIGGDKDTVEKLRPIFEALAPAPDRGWGHVGPPGAGHFVKMVHNGIEYGLMQSYAEGFAILQSKADFHLNLEQISKIWQYGSVVRSWLLDLIADALQQNPTLTGVSPFVADSGEGRWTVAEAIDADVPAPVITLSLLERLRSRQADSFSDKLLAIMRNEFGGHVVKREEQR